MSTLKVEVAALITNAEKVRARLVREHERKEAALAPALSKPETKRQLVAALRKLAKDIERGATPLPKVDRSYSSKQSRYVNRVSAYASVETGGEEVDRDRELDEVEADLKLLRSTTQETVGVQVGSNLARYL